MTVVNTHGAECPHWGIELNGANTRGNFRIKEGVLYHFFSIKHHKENGRCSTVSAGSSMDIFDGEWHHIVYISDYMIDKEVRGYGKRSIYIDGVSRSMKNHSFEDNGIIFSHLQHLYILVQESFLENRQVTSWV